MTETDTTNDVEDVTEEEHEGPTPAPTTGTKTKPHAKGGDGLRQYAQQQKSRADEAEARADELDRQCLWWRREAVLADAHTPAQFRKVAHARQLEPTREALAELKRELEAEARSAQALLQQWDDGARSELPYSPEEISAAVSTALAKALAPSADEDDEEDWGDE